MVHLPFLASDVTYNRRLGTTRVNSGSRAGDNSNLVRCQSDPTRLHPIQFPRTALTFLRAHLPYLLLWARPTTERVNESGNPHGARCGHAYRRGTVCDRVAVERVPSIITLCLRSRSDVLGKSPYIPLS